MADGIELLVTWGSGVFSGGALAWIGHHFRLKQLEKTHTDRLKQLEIAHLGRLEEQGPAHQRRLIEMEQSHQHRIKEGLEQILAALDVETLRGTIAEELQRSQHGLNESLEQLKHHWAKELERERYGKGEWQRARIPEAAKIAVEYCELAEGVKFDLSYKTAVIEQAQQTGNVGDDVWGRLDAATTKAKRMLTLSSMASLFISFDVCARIRTHAFAIERTATVAKAFLHAARAIKAGFDDPETQKHFEHNPAEWKKGFDAVYDQSFDILENVSGEVRRALFSASDKD